MQLLRRTAQAQAFLSMKRIRTSICGIGIIIALGLVSIQCIGLVLTDTQLAQSIPQSPTQQFVSHLADAGMIVLTSVFSFTS